MDTKDKIKEVLKKEGVTWAQYTETAGYKSIGGFRKILFNHLDKLTKFLAMIGYEIVIKKIK
ncbi:hypothetical protein B0O44_11289 [Pedobacter nutrimenti]|uniref:HTH cro/C1-type domain-containing protein n=1 Tax=Pedobacter nutrimenti TaxID=1241337 RepID=A0A318U7J0_9SPHI|nr:hypothetical protein B0O44_11289 [Pedobacter nutrimenti]